MDLSHIAIIMDGNRRWAKGRGLSALKGHNEGAKSVEVVLKGAEKYGIKYVTLYAFSSENWQRSDEEISYLQKIFHEYMSKELDSIHKRGVRVRFIGEFSKFTQKTRDLIQNSEELTKNNNKLTLIIALGYGGRQDIIEASVKMANDFKNSKIDLANKTESETQSIFESYLQTNFAPNPDLVLRTSGEYRISNFLLYQISYSELYFIDVLWPDFREEHFDVMVEEFKKRERRYGGK